MPIVVGVDVGGSKTLAAIASTDGTLLGAGRGPGGNRQTVGAAGFRSAVDAAVSAALTAAATTVDDVVATHVGAAGADLPADLEELRAALGDGYPSVVVENDSLLGIHAGTTAGWGGVVVAGSGTNAAAVAPDGRTLFVGGVGWHTGDWGGASFLGIEGIRLAIRSWEQREPPSSLPDRLVLLMGAASMQEVFERVATYAGPDPLDVAPLVVAAARDGDGPAGELLAAFGREMGVSVGTALRRLDLAAASPETVLLGGLAQMAHDTVLVDACREALREQAPSATLALLECEPVIGAVVAAVRAAGGDRPGLAADLRAQWAAR
jgi:N-acetylglucosamine kinase-like BadF-type ATPase